MFWSCGGCKGRGVTLAVLRRVMDRDALNALWRAALDSGEPGERRCPTCSNPMLAIAATGAEGAPELDVCRGCLLVWFDDGEYYRMPATEAEEKVEARDLPDEARREIAMLELRRIAGQAGGAAERESDGLWAAFARALGRSFP